MAILVSGSGSEGLRLTLAEHIYDCAECRALLAECVQVAEAEHASSDWGSDQDAAAQLDPEAVRAMLARRGAPVETQDGDSAQPTLLPLRPLVSENQDHHKRTNLPLAAKSADEGSDPVPTLVSADHSILINFRRAAPDGPYRAYVIRKKRESAAGLRLIFPSRGLSFKMRARGEVDLPGIRTQDLLDSRIQMELHPFDDRADGSRD